VTGWLAAVAPPSADEIRQAAVRVFARPEFRPTETGAGGWLLRQLAEFFQWLGGLYEAAPALFWLILIGCVIALVGLIALMVFQVRSAFAGGRGRRAGSAEQAERARRSAAYRDEADRRAAAGDYTEAVRHLFLSLVYRFDERGRINFRGEYTNREYLDLLSDRGSIRDAVRVLVDTLDDHWYGQRPCGRPQYEQCRAVYDRLAA
jgi:hypothetical protein